MGCIVCEWLRKRVAGNGWETEWELTVSLAPEPERNSSLCLQLSRTKGEQAEL